jgi:hypothetical protein
LNNSLCGNSRIKNWGSVVQFVKSKKLHLLLSGQLKQLGFQYVGDHVINDERTFIDTDDLDLRTMDSKRGGKSIDELGSTSVGKELGESPL